MATPDFDVLLGLLHGLLISLGPALSPDEVDEVSELLDHAELGEALRTLAWLIVEEEKVVPHASIGQIESLAIRMRMTDELPVGLAQCGVEDG
jgi:hypothetical protein